MQDTEQEPRLSCLQPLYNVKTLSPEDPANLAKSVGLGWPKEVSKMKEGEVGGKRIMRSSWSTSQWVGKCDSHCSLIPRPPTRPGYEATHNGNKGKYGCMA